MQNVLEDKCKFIYILICANGIDLMLLITHRHGNIGTAPNRASMDWKFTMIERKYTDKMQRVEQRLSVFFAPSPARTTKSRL